MEKRIWKIETTGWERKITDKAENKKNKWKIHKGKEMDGSIYFL